MVRAETIARRPPSAGRSNRSTSSTSLPSARVICTLATSRPARAARRMATNSDFTTGKVSVLEVNLAISYRGPSDSSAFGRAPPTELPCNSA